MGSRAIYPGGRSVGRHPWVGELVLRDDRLNGGTRFWLPGFGGGSSCLCDPMWLLFGLGITRKAGAALEIIETLLELLP